MIQEPITIGPENSMLEARNVMKKNDIGCLPVAKAGELIGLVTALDLLKINTRGWE